MFAASFVYSYQASFATQQSQRFEGPRSLQEELCVKRSCVVEELCVKVIDEVRGAEDAHTHYHTDDGTSDFMSTTATSLTTPLHLTSVEIARREIQVWKSQTIPLPKTSNPLKEWRRGVKIFPWLSLLAW